MELGRVPHLVAVLGRKRIRFVINLPGFFFSFCLLFSLGVALLAVLSSVCVD